MNSIISQSSECKYGNDNDIIDTGILMTKHPENSTVLMDRRYQGAQQYVRAIIPKKKLMENCHLLRMKVGVQQLQVVAQLLIICHFLFSHNTSGWMKGMMLSPLSLTNFHSSFHPLLQNTALLTTCKKCRMRHKNYCEKFYKITSRHQAQLVDMGYGLEGG